MMRASVCPATLMMKLATLFIKPVLSNPAPTIITAMIDITALLENPPNRSRPGTNGWGSAIRLPK